MGSKSATPNGVEPSLPDTDSAYSLQLIISNVKGRQTLCIGGPFTKRGDIYVKESVLSTLW